MSRKTEDKAKRYLINEFKRERYEFSDKNPNETGFDLWMKDKSSSKSIKIELKSTEGGWKKWSDIFQKLYFSAEEEVKNFEQGETKIVRVFLGNEPPKVFIFDRSIFDKGARFKTEYRAKIVGSIHYESIKEIQ